MHSKTLSRSEFLKLSAGLIGAATLPFGLGCPADDTGDEGAESGNITTAPAEESGTTAGDGDTAASGCTMDPTATIAANHGHELVVPLADVVAGVEATYDIMGTSPHAHSVTLTADHFAMLQAGMQVSVTSTAGGDHTHEVTVSCG